MKPVLMATCIQRPPVLKSLYVMSQRRLYNIILTCIQIKTMAIKATILWPQLGHLIQVSLYINIRIMLQKA